MNLIDVIEMCERQFPGWQWLVRSDEAKGAFANFHGPNEMDWIDGETCFPVWAETPAEALHGALKWAVSANGGTQ